jgi:hypothetical protein
MRKWHMQHVKVDNWNSPTIKGATENARRLALAQGLRRSSTTSTYLESIFFLINPLLEVGASCDC